MKITLFLDDRIREFNLPNQISGSFSYDFSDEENDKLINVEAQNGKWVLYGNDVVSIYSNNQLFQNIELESNNFYTIKRNDIMYLIYVSNALNRIIKAFTYDENSIINIANNINSTILYNCQYMNNLMVQLIKNNNYMTIKSNLDAGFYVNNEKVMVPEINVAFGSYINIFGLKILILPNILIFNFPTGLVSIGSTNMRPFQYDVEEFQNIVVKDIDLYNKEDFFSKYPRIRRQIETKEIKIDHPPKLKSTEVASFFITIGPMVSLLATSCINLLNVTLRISNGETTFAKSWTTFASCSAMIFTSLIWPFVTKYFNKRQSIKDNQKIEKKYSEYLKGKEEELKAEEVFQRSVILENLLSCKECLDIINSRKTVFWSKRKDQNDFLNVRVGIGKVLLDVKIDWPEEGFSLDEDNLKKMADEVVDNNKYIENIPLGYSLYDNYFTGIMGPDNMCTTFVNNIVLQLMTYYSYDELKFVVFSDDKKAHNWDYIKYSSYNFNVDKSVRFFATNSFEYKNLSDYFYQELNSRIENSKDFKGRDHKQYYVIICDNYGEAKKYDFFEKLVECEENIGYSLLIIDNVLSNLPSKCVNLITLNKGLSGMLKNSFESAQITEFHDEIEYGIDMMSVARCLSNIPVEISDEESLLPNVISFLEMEKVGKVEQLNILNRWSLNDSTKSLRAEVGVDAQNNYMYLDLHEKAHGPHGLIAGMTGSGKSEFIITYILSMAMNYSPEDVSFVLIDYKGGGLAGAFENEVTNIRLPHLAGKITNLDKSELNRTLVSIDSETKRRQMLFNEARDKLGESTIDIYKYQNYYHQGKLTEPISHLFIICDEFAELKSQQPDFMDNLISVARIGRSLGVHLILATQKPSGVVNDQIWSNSRFRVCLKVQDASDSNEMLKKPDAASIKQTGRFYLQVGYNEYYSLGQSAWCGAKYYPSEKFKKIIDKSINFISTDGSIIKSIEDNNEKKIEAQGEQILAVLKEIMSVAGKVNKYSKRLWLDNIKDVILLDSIENKYNFMPVDNNIEAIVGEYDAPELQQQGILKYNLLDDGNTVLYSADGSDNEMFLSTIIYSLAKNYSSNDINIYAIDYGSESLRIFNNLPHFGGIVTESDEDKYNNLIELLRNETASRKELFVNYGGEYKNYLRTTNNKLPVYLVIINNFDGAKNSIQSLVEDLPDLVRDSDRYGIVYLFTANGANSVGSKITQNCKNAFCFKLKDMYDYSSVLGSKVKNPPKEVIGRGICKIEGVHEFQTASIVESSDDLNSYILDFVNKTIETNPVKAKKIPSLPDFVTYDEISTAIKLYENIPIGISKNTLEVTGINLDETVGTMFLSNKIDNITNFSSSFISLINKLDGLGSILIDVQGNLSNKMSEVDEYYNDDFDNVLDKISQLVENNINNSIEERKIIIINNFTKFVNKLSDSKKLGSLFDNMKKYEKICVVAIDDVNKIKQFNFEPWFKAMFSGQNGVWIGSGISDQQLLKVSSFSKEFRVNYKNNMGFYVNSSDCTLIKLLDFDKKGSDKNE